MFEWTGQVGPATILAGLSFVTTAGGLAFAWWKGIGVREADHVYLRQRFESLETRVKSAEERFMPGSAIEKRFDTAEDAMRALLKRMEAHEVAVSGGSLIMREQIAENARLASERYFTKTEASAMEERQNRGVDRVVDEVRRLTDRFDDFNQNVMGLLRRPN